MSNDDKNSRDAHNKGQSDYSSGKYEKPHGFGSSVTHFGSKGFAKIRRENEAYEKGWNNAKKQK